MDRSAHPSIHPRGKLMLGDLGKTPPPPQGFLIGPEPVSLSPFPSPLSPPFSLGFLQPL